MDSKRKGMRVKWGRWSGTVAVKVGGAGALSAATLHTRQGMSIAVVQWANPTVPAANCTQQRDDSSGSVAIDRQHQR